MLINPVTSARAHKHKQTNQPALPFWKFSINNNKLKIIMENRRTIKHKHKNVICVQYKNKCENQQPTLNT